ncbi:DUF5685 family protein [Streptomyces sp. NPDC001380]|uniref:DUF5685 family protein n=1 Tax=Streptomyces sp. NPDC001380 TaxID=3364566 RepID=UPI00368B9173
MFGIIRPCRHRLSERLRASWTAHLCGLCLALRDDHGQLARTATNYDGLIVSVLVEAQSERAPSAGRRTAGPCPLRGMRTAEVARGEGARLAAAVSLALAAVKVRDHVEDRDGAFARRPVAAGARAVADRWGRQSADGAAVVGFDTGVLLDAAARQGELERAAGPGTPVLRVTEPTETATAAAFAHTAVLAGRPGNAAPLAEAGRLFGRLAHLLDAAEDLREDAERGAWNPLAATGTAPEEAERLCRDAVHGIRLALRDAEFTDGALVHRLLAHETGRAVDRVLGGSAHACASASHGSPQAPGAAHLPAPPPPRRRGLLAGCAMAAYLACTCRLCCSEEYEGPWSRQKRQGCCHQADCCDCSSCDCESGGCCGSGDGCCGCDGCGCDSCGCDGCCDCDCCGCDC